MTLRELVMVVNNEVETNSLLFPPSNPLSFTYYLIMKSYVYTHI